MIDANRLSIIQLGMRDTGLKTAIAFMVLVLSVTGYTSEARGQEDVCWRPTTTRGVGTPLICAPAEDYDWGLCYPKCRAGFAGVANYCWQMCPADYRDDGFYCAKSAYSRGVGRAHVGSCAPNEDEDAGLCYDRCNDGYSGAGPGCWQQCPPSFDDIGVSCHKPSEDRGVGKAIHTCPEGNQQDAGLCYPPCGGDFLGAGPVCWRSCPPAFPVSCGAGCAKTDTACGVATTSQVLKPIKLVVDLVMQDPGAIGDAIETANAFNVPLCSYPLNEVMVNALKNRSGTDKWRFMAAKPPPQ